MRLWSVSSLVQIMACRQSSPTIIWTNVEILLIGPLCTYFSEILIGIQTFSFKKLHFKMSSAKWRLFCLGLIELSTGWPRLKWHSQMYSSRQTYSHIIHYNDVIMGAIASQITGLTIVCSIVYSDADQRKHQSCASLVFVLGIHRGPLNSPHKWPVTRKMFPFDDVIMFWLCLFCVSCHC